MWWAKLVEILRAVYDGSTSINVTIVGGAVGGSDVAQGDPNADDAKGWKVRLFNSTGELLGRLAAAASIPVVLSTEDKAALDAAATQTTLAALNAKIAARAATAALTASAALPAAGAYESDPADGNCVAIPTGARKATIMISYTRGDTGGYAGHKVFLSDGTRVGQVQAPDGTYAGVNGRASTGAGAILYSLDVDVAGGATKIGIASAEVGVAGTPGTVASWVTFG